MKALVLFFVALLTMSFSGCDREDEVVPANVDQLVGTWQLSEPKSDYRISLSIENDSINAFPFSLRLSGESSVNLYFATMRYNAGGLADARGQLAVSELGATKRAGSPDAMQFEQTYFTHLKVVNRYELTANDQLRLYYSGEQSGVLVYERTK